MKLKVLFHDNCFDGIVSAALFTRFFREKIDEAAEIDHQGLQHTHGDAFPPGCFDSDQHACLDFRYSSSPKLTWWFDHHVSAFQSPADRAHFEADTGGHKFYDPAARSCTKFMADTLAARFGFDVARFADLIEWADLIDSARFPDARTAVELAEPALRLMTWIEHNKDHALKRQMIADLTTTPIAELAEREYVRRPLEPLLEKHAHAIDVIRARADERDGVVFFDLLDTDIEAHNKFIAYMLFPACRYTVGLTRSPSRLKIAVGSNPWSQVPRAHDIAKICERHGGGGHPVVGAISLGPKERERVHQVAAEIVAELSRPV